MAFYILHPCYFSISVKEACATTCNEHKMDIKFISDSPSKGTMAVSILLGGVRYRLGLLKNSNADDSE